MYLYEKIAKEKEKQKIFQKEEEARKKYLKDQERKHNSYISVLGSSSHNYGNALAMMQKYIIDLFPKNMFETIHVNSKLAHCQIRSVPHEFIKKGTPMIIFRPRVGEYNEERFLKGTALIERQNDLYQTWGGGNLQSFFEDQQNDIRIKYQMNRVVMYIDVMLIFSTLMHQLDFYAYLYNRIPFEKPMFITTCLESFIPEELLDIVSKCARIPMYDEQNSTKDFFDYMNSKSKDPITYKLQGSTNNKEFYRYYPTTVDAIFTDLQKDDPDRVGVVVDKASISFTVRMEFNTVGLYYLFNEHVFDFDIPVFKPEESELIPMFTDIYKKEDLMLNPGWDLYNRGSIILDTANDELCFEGMLNQSIIECMKYHFKNGLPLSNFIDIRIRKQGEPISEGTEYTIDWVNKKINFINQNTYSTFTIFICINIEYVNTLVKSVYNLK